MEAGPLHGKRLRLSAALRYEAQLPRGGVHLWARTTRADGSTQPVDLGERPVRTPEWAATQLVVDVPDDTTYLALGARIEGCGTAWLDAFELEAMKGVTRFEVIDEEGRTYVNHLLEDQRVKFSLQDDDRTLKVFIDSKSWKEDL